jgi:hypothetical protein
MLIYEITWAGAKAKVANAASAWKSQAAAVGRGIKGIAAQGINDTLGTTIGQNPYAGGTAQQKASTMAAPVIKSLARKNAQQWSDAVGQAMKRENVSTPSGLSQTSIQTLKQNLLQQVHNNLLQRMLGNDYNKLTTMSDDPAVKQQAQALVQSITDSVNTLIGSVSATAQQQPVAKPNYGQPSAYGKTTINAPTGVPNPLARTGLPQPAQQQPAQQQPVAKPNYGQPSAYGKTTINAPTGVPNPLARTGLPQPTTTVNPTVKMPPDNRVNRANPNNPNIAAQSPYVQGRAGFGQGSDATKFAKFTPQTSATANLAQGMNNMIRPASTTAPGTKPKLAPTAKQKQPAMAEAFDRFAVPAATREIWADAWQKLSQATYDAMSLIQFNQDKLSRNHQTSPTIQQNKNGNYQIGRTLIDPSKTTMVDIEKLIDTEKSPSGQPPKITIAPSGQISVGKLVLDGTNPVHKELIDIIEKEMP